MTNRIPCINPRCRPTFKLEREDEEVICGKCFRMLPTEIRSEHRPIWRGIREWNRRITRTSFSKATRPNRRRADAMELQPKLLRLSWQKVAPHAGAMIRLAAREWKATTLFKRDDLVLQSSCLLTSVKLNNHALSMGVANCSTVAAQALFIHLSSFTINAKRDASYEHLKRLTLCTAPYASCEKIRWQIELTHAAQHIASLPKVSEEVLEERMVLRLQIRPRLQCFHDERADLDLVHTVLHDSHRPPSNTITPLDRSLQVLRKQENGRGCARGLERLLS